MSDVVDAPPEERVKEYKAFSLEVAAAPNDEGRFTGAASVFGNLDLNGDIVERGAFDKTLAENPFPPGLWQHDPWEPIAGTNALTVAERDLELDASLVLEVQRAREARALVQAGVVKGISIGYYAVKFAKERTSTVARGFVRHLTEVMLVEWSLVTFPANPLAQVHSMKGMMRAGVISPDDLLQALLGAVEPADDSHSPAEGAAAHTLEPASEATLRALIASLRSTGS